MTSDASRVDEGKGKIGKGQLGSHLLGVPLAMQVGCLERGQPNETKRNPPLWLKLSAGRNDSRPVRKSWKLHSCSRC